MARARIDGKTAEHEARVPVTENLNHCMYLREVIAEGKGPNGEPIEISQTGPHIIIQLGAFGTGRQFTVSIAKMAEAVLEQLTQPTIDTKEKG